ncbi:MAG: MBL fold metallo-hydrolase RNA specificity domain-containing protein [Anaerolineaceae bacterium]
MKVHFNGAAHTVTGSQYLLEVNNKRILMECGFFQGKRADSSFKNKFFPFDPKTVDAVLLSHAHIDHSGNLPNLVKNGYAGPIYATHATADLADIMLRDSGHIQEADAEYINKKRARRGEPPISPIYTEADAAKVADHFHPLSYNQSVEVVPGVTVHLVDAGHILGSAAVVLDVKENGAQGRGFRFWFSGDIGRKDLPLLKDPILPKDADYLMMECTYGDKSHEDPDQAYNEFREVVMRTFKRGGRLIIPAFAVGRTQELVYSLNRMVTNGDIQPVPVFVDSPLAVRASDIFRKHNDLFDEETRQFVMDGRHPALDFPGLTYTRSVEESKALNDRHDPMVIISASGMAEAGRILHHLKNNIENPRNTVAIVGWCAPDTLGRRLAERQTEVKIFGVKYERRAEIVTIGGFSAHAGQDQLLNYAAASRSTLRQIVLIHAEDDAETAFRTKLEEARLPSVHYPAQSEILEFT